MGRDLHQRTFALDPRRRPLDFELRLANRLDDRVVERQRLEPLLRLGDRPAQHGDAIASLLQLGELRLRAPHLEIALLPRLLRLGLGESGLRRLRSLIGMLDLGGGFGADYETGLALLWLARRHAVDRHHRCRRLLRQAETIFRRMGAEADLREVSQLLGVLEHGRAENA